jgi:MFS family permease
VRVFSVSLSLLFAVALSLAGNGLLGTVAAVRLADTGSPQTVIGFVLAMYFAGLAVGTQLIGPTIARIGHIRAFAAFTALAVASALGHGLVAPGWLWGPLRGLTGFCMAGTYMTVESWLNAEARPESRGRVLAAYLVALYLGSGIGQAFLPLWPATGFELFAVSSLLASLAVVPVCMTRILAPTLERTSVLPGSMLLREAPIGWGGALVSGFIGATIYASAPVFARNSGLSSSSVSLLMIAFLAGGLLGQWPLGWLSDRTDRRIVLVGVAGTLLVLCGGFLMVAESPSALWFALAFGFGALTFSIYPLAVAHTIDRVGAERSLPAASQLLLASSAGAVAGPILASQAGRFFGPAAFLATDAVLILVFLGLAVPRILRVAPSPQGLYQPLPRTTLGAHELDPRTDESVPEPAGGRRFEPRRPEVGGALPNP